MGTNDKLDEEQAVAVRELDPSAHLALQYNKYCLNAAFYASSRLLDLKSEAPRFKRTNIGAAIAADVKRFCHRIKWTEFSAHTKKSVSNPALPTTPRTCY
jgi:hypothetical protein